MDIDMRASEQGELESHSQGACADELRKHSKENGFFRQDKNDQIALGFRA